MSGDDPKVETCIEAVKRSRGCGCSGWKMPHAVLLSLFISRTWHDYQNDERLLTGLAAFYLFFCGIKISARLLDPRLSYHISYLG